MTVQERFAADWGMPIHEVERLVRLAQQAGHCNEKACNGEPFYRAKGPAVVGFVHVTDKNEASRYWSAKVDETTAIIEQLVRRFGFTAVVYTGLGPTLKRGEQFVEIPY